jgi:DNA-binding PadR family transcriptional regulator
MDIKTLCLGVLSLGDSTGYEIKKMFEVGPFSYFYEASFGSIYPALNRLTAENLVACTQFAQDKRPDKKVYSLTPAGRRAFAEEITKPPGRDRLRSEFLVTVTFSQFLSPQQLSRVIDDRIDFHQQQIDQMGQLRQTCGGSPLQQFTIGLGETMHTAAVNYLAENRHLLEDDPASPEKAAE